MIDLNKEYTTRDGRETERDSNDKRKPTWTNREAPSWKRN